MYLAFVLEILQNKMSHSILDSMYVVLFLFLVGAFCLAIELHEHMDPMYHLNLLLVSPYPVVCLYVVFIVYSIFVE